ncbi:MAG: chalcone isomerase family protein [Betaproteobacteria bacterium]|nr:chalcone isomerase family protein [Betaproteobacteria bacterium]
MKAIPALLLIAASALASAAEVAGVTLAETVQIASGGPQLVLNGAGLRKRVFFDVYAMGLYLPVKKAGAADVLSLPGPKRVAIRMLRDVDADQFADALVEGIRQNDSEADAKTLAPRLKELTAIMSEMKEAKKGMSIALDWVPGTGTLVQIEGKPAGKPIAGEDFYRALLRIWLGEDPVQADLKKALLGQPQ